MEEEFAATGSAEVSAQDSYDLADVDMIIDAAGASDIACLADWMHAAGRLRSTLDLVNSAHESNADDCTWDTPLLRAIACQQHESIEILLANGANPNGIIPVHQEQYSRLFRRFRTVHCTRVEPVRRDEVSPIELQMFPLTKEELRLRQSTVSKFWTSIDTPPLDRSKNGDRLHSLIMAARTTPAIFDRILDAGADASAWLGGERTSATRLDYTSPSALCVSTPPHHALEDERMLRHILSRGFSPIAQAFSAGCHALTPIHQAIYKKNLQAFNILASTPHTDCSIVTPVYRIHPLHFAVAQHDLEFLEALQIPLQSAKPTALGHNLAHIVCLPRTALEIQLFAPKVKRSIHDVSSLDPRWQPNHEFEYATSVIRHVTRARSPDCDGPRPQYVSDDGLQQYYFGEAVAQRQQTGPSMRRPFAVLSADHHVEQARVLRYLVDSLDIDLVAQQDYCGNTPMHFLAAQRTVNDELISWLRSFDVADRIWRLQENYYGFTPEDLWRDNVTVIECVRSVSPRGGHGNMRRDKSLPKR